MSAANRVAGVRHEGDFYETPAWVTEAIVPYLPAPRGLTLDAGCGTGAIGHVLQRHGHDVIGVDNDAHISSACRFPVFEADYLTWLGDPEVRLCVMNPPFVHALDFVMRAISSVVMNGGAVAALMRLAMLEGQARRAFHVQFPSDVYVLSRRPSFTGGGTDATAYAWFVWGTGRGGRWSILDGGRA